MNDWVVPAILLLMLLCGLVRRVQVYDVFLEGARAGLRTAWDVLPCLTAMLAAVALLTASGAMEALLSGLAPALQRLGVPEGRAARAADSAVFRLGDDGDAGKHFGHLRAGQPGGTHSVRDDGLQRDHFLYRLALPGRGGVRRARHAIPAALLAWLAGGLASAWLCRWL